MRRIKISTLALMTALTLGSCSKSDKDKKDDDGGGKSTGEGEPPALTMTDLCETNMADTCARLEQEAAALRQARDEALAQSNLIAAIEHQVGAERALAHLELYRIGSEEGDERHGKVEETHALMLAMVQGDPSRAVDTESDCGEHRDLCERLRADLQTLYADYIMLAEQHGEDGVVDRRTEINFRQELLGSYIGGPNAGQLDVLQAANRSLSGIVDLLTIGTEVGYVVPRKKPCTEATIERCRELEDRLVQLRQQVQIAVGESDEARVNELSVELNYTSEVLDLLRKGQPLDSEDIAAATKRFEKLRSIISANRPAYKEEELREVARVTEKYGALYIKESSWQMVEAEQHRPWSGYWYPFRHDDMFADENSPLQKFDALLAALGRPAGAAAWERERQQAGQPWESSDGLCDAWAIASSRHVEPTQIVTAQGISFEPMHLKGLLVQKYANFQKDRFGIPYTGYLETDGLAQDLRPEAFHVLISSLLKNNEVPAVDTDPNFPIWNMPLYKYEWSVVRDQEIANAFIVEAKPWFVRWRTNQSNEPTNYTVGRNSDLYLPKYRYRLIVNPAEQDDNGAFRVIYGEWIVTDLAPEYPDVVYRIPTDQAVTPRNPVIAANLDLIEAMISQSE